MATLKQGTTRAKQIRKAHPNKSWIDCVKQAHRELGKGKKHKPAAKRKAAVKKVKVHRTKARVASVTHSVGSVSLAHLRSEGTKMLESKYGHLATKKALEKGKLKKRKLQKEMAAVLSSLRKLKSI